MKIQSKSFLIHFDTSFDKDTCSIILQAAEFCVNHFNKVTKNEHKDFFKEGKFKLQIKKRKSKLFQSSMRLGVCYKYQKRIMVNIDLRVTKHHHRYGKYEDMPEFDTEGWVEDFIMTMGHELCHLSYKDDEPYKFNFLTHRKEYKRERTQRNRKEEFACELFGADTVLAFRKSGIVFQAQEVQKTKVPRDNEVKEFDRKIAELRKFLASNQIKKEKYVGRMFKLIAPAGQVFVNHWGDGVKSKIFYNNLDAYDAYKRGDLNLKNEIISEKIAV